MRRVARADSATTCVVADDHPAIRAVVKELLEAEHIEVVAVARDGTDALAAIERHAPDVAVLDLAMPGLSGIEVARRLQRLAPATSIVVYTANADRGALSDALDSGARGYVLKGAPLPDLVRAIETVLAGGTYVDPVLAGSLAGAQAADSRPDLTKREREVLRLLADGLSNEEIGRELFLSPETVRTHLRKAMGKLGAGTRTQAVAIAIRLSLID